MSSSQNAWTKSDYILLAFGCLMNFGDGIEINLPGVITQRVSCEMSVVSVQESILGSVFYMTLSFSIIIAGPLAVRFGRREVCLFSLYTNALVSILCAIVANFYTLLLSRALIGFTVGFNLVIHCVLISEQVSCKAVLNKIWLMMSIVYSLGGVWVSVLGYLTLDKVGWRVFVVLTSLPVSIPPIIILHFYISPEQEESNEDEVDAESDVLSISEVITRTCKAAIFIATGFFESWSTILILPALIKMLNMKQGSARAANISLRAWSFSCWL